MARVGWHLDDVPQPFLTLRRLAFLVIGLCFIGGPVAAWLLIFDGTHHRSLAVPGALFGAAFVCSVLAGGVFGWTNTKSARWLEWRETTSSLTPGWPRADSDG